MADSRVSSSKSQTKPATYFESKERKWPKNKGPHAIVSKGYKTQFRVISAAISEKLGPLNKW
jgi:hypothetical protein